MYAKACIINLNVGKKQNVQFNQLRKSLASLFRKYMKNHVENIYLEVLKFQSVLISFDKF